MSFRLRSAPPGLRGRIGGAELTVQCRLGPGNRIAALRYAREPNTGANQSHGAQKNESFVVGGERHAGEAIAEV